MVAAVPATMSRPLIMPATSSVPQQQTAAAQASDQRPGSSGNSSNWQATVNGYDRPKTDMRCVCICWWRFGHSTTCSVARQMLCDVLVRLFVFLWDYSSASVNSLQLSSDFTYTCGHY